MEQFTAAKLIEELNKLPPTTIVSFKYFDWNTQEYVTHPIEDIYSISENQAVVV